MFNHYQNLAVDLKQKDIMLIFSGDQPQFQLFSVKAHKEFLKLLPLKIDRSNIFGDTMLKLARGALDQLSSTKSHALIRKEFMKALGMSTLSSKIPEILLILDENLKKWPENEEINIISYLMEITFDVISHAFFGPNFKTKIHL